MFYRCVICDCVCVLKYAIYLIWPRQFSFGPDSSHLAHVFLIWLIPWPEQKMSQRGPCHRLIRKKGKTMDFSETSVIYDLKLAIDIQSDRKFLLISKLCPCPGAIYMY